MPDTPETAAQLGVVALLTSVLDQDADRVVVELEALSDELGLPALHFAMFWAIGTLVADVASLRGISHRQVAQALAAVAVEDASPH